MHSKAQIDQILRQKSDAAEIPGVVAVAASGSEVIYQGAFGKRDLSKPDNMTTDSVFWIASMTKAVTTAAAMQLVEQGKLSLEAPIGKLLVRAHDISESGFSFTTDVTLHVGDHIMLGLRHDDEMLVVATVRNVRRQGELFVVGAERIATS